MRIRARGPERRYQRTSRKQTTTAATTATTPPTHHQNTSVSSALPPWFAPGAPCVPGTWTIGGWTIGVGGRTTTGGRTNWAWHGRAQAASTTSKVTSDVQRIGAPVVLARN